MLHTLRRRFLPLCLCFGAMAWCAPTMAGVAAGVYSTLAETGESLVRWEREYQPDAANHEIYLLQKSNWQAVYADQLGLVDRELTTSMWKAPGL